MDNNKGKPLDLENDTHILSSVDAKEFINCIVSLMSDIEDSAKKDHTSGSSIDLTSNSVYHLVGKDAENEEELICSILYRVLFAIDMLDAGGKPLSSIHTDFNKKLSLNT